MGINSRGFLSLIVGISSYNCLGFDVTVTYSINYIFSLLGLFLSGDWVIELMTFSLEIYKNKIIYQLLNDTN